MKIKTKVLTTTDEQDLSSRQKQNARTNIAAQTVLTADEDSHIALENVTDDAGNVVSTKIKVDGELGREYTAGSDYVTVVNGESNTVDLSESTKLKVDAATVQSDWTTTDTADVSYIKNKPDVYTKTEIDNKLKARAMFFATKDELDAYIAQRQAEGKDCQSNIYYVGPKASATGNDKYDVYEFNGTELVMVDESNISLDGYWHGAITSTGDGNAVTSITVDSAGAVTVHSDSEFALASELTSTTVSVGDYLAVDSTTEGYVTDYKVSLEEAPVAVIGENGIAITEKDENTMSIGLSETPVALVPGEGITIDDSVQGELKISATGSVTTVEAEEGSFITVTDAAAAGGMDHQYTIGMETPSTLSAGDYLTISESSTEVKIELDETPISIVQGEGITITDSTDTMTIGLTKPMTKITAGTSGNLSVTENTTTNTYTIDASNTVTTVAGATGGGITVTDNGSTGNHQYTIGLSTPMTKITAGTSGNLSVTENTTTNTYTIDSVDTNTVTTVTSTEAMISVVDTITGTDHQYEISFTDEPTDVVAGTGIAITESGNQVKIGLESAPLNVVPGDGIVFDESVSGQITISSNLEFPTITAGNTNITVSPVTDNTITISSVDTITTVKTADDETLLKVTASETDAHEYTIGTKEAPIELKGENGIAIDVDAVSGDVIVKLDEDPYKIEAGDGIAIDLDTVNDKLIISADVTSTTTVTSGTPEYLTVTGTPEDEPTDFEISLAATPLTIKQGNGITITEGATDITIASTVEQVTVSSSTPTYLSVTGTPTESPTAYSVGLVDTPLNIVQGNGISVTENESDELVISSTVVVPTLTNGDNITLTPDTTNNTIEISASATSIVSATDDITITKSETDNEYSLDFTEPLTKLEAGTGIVFDDTSVENTTQIKLDTELYNTITNTVMFVAGEHITLEPDASGNLVIDAIVGGGGSSSISALSCKSSVTGITATGTSVLSTSMTDVVLPDDGKFKLKLVDTIPQILVKKSVKAFLLGITENVTRTEVSGYMYDNRLDVYRNGNSTAVHTVKDAYTSSMGYGRLVDSTVLSNSGDGTVVTVDGVEYYAYSVKFAGDVPTAEGDTLSVTAEVRVEDVETGGQTYSATYTVE